MLEMTEQTMGLRFLGQRFVFDSYTLGELVFKHIGPNPNDANYQYVLDNLDPMCIEETEEEKVTYNFESCQGQSLADWRYICCSAVNLAIKEDRHELSEVCRLLPSGLDVAAAFGSDRAREHLKDDIDGYCEYKEQLDSLQQEASAFTQQDWWKTLYNGWLYALQPFFNKDLTGFPVWMTTDAYKSVFKKVLLSSFGRDGPICGVAPPRNSAASPSSSRLAFWTVALRNTRSDLIKHALRTRA